MYAIIDCNSFYVSCEQSFRPDLKGKPVVVLSNNDGCVVSRSLEAKKIGIPMAAPAFKYSKLFKENNVTVFSSNYALYGDMSTRVMNILKNYSSDVHVYSIDEAFIKLSNDISDYESYGTLIKNKIFQYTGIPTSIGIANTKALSKVANNVAKKFQRRTKGVFVIDSEVKRVKTLKWTKISDVWGIGRGNNKRLLNVRAKTAYDFIQLNDSWIKSNMKVMGLRLKKELNGESVLKLSDIRDKKTIATTRSFETTFSNYEDVKERIATFSYSCAEKLRKQKSSCMMLYVFLRTNRYDNTNSYLRLNKLITLPYPTDSTLVIVDYAIRALNMIYRPNIEYKKAGVILMEIKAINTKQLDLFENENPKHKPLMNVIDRLNNKFGDFKIKIANQDLQRTWKMKQNHLSPQYTSKISDVIQVNCEK